MSDGSSGPPRLALGPFVSVSGSIASLVALVIVFIDKVAASQEVAPQFVVWRLALCFASLIAIGAIITLTYHLIAVTLTTPTRSAPGRILRVTFLAVVGLFATALFLDGLFASIYWRWWLGDVVGFMYKPKTQDKTSPVAANKAASPSSGQALIFGKTINIFFADARTEDAIRAKLQLEQRGATVGLISKPPGVIVQPNTVYYRNGSFLEVAIEVQNLLAPIGVTNRSVAAWASPSADLVVSIR